MDPDHAASTSSSELVVGKPEYLVKKHGKQNMVINLSI